MLLLDSVPESECLYNKKEYIDNVYQVLLGNPIVNLALMRGYTLLNLLRAGL